MGMLLVGHVHDPSPLSVGLHATFGYFLICLGGAVLLCSFTHDLLPHAHPMCHTMRMVHAFAWLLTGGITVTMCVVKYGTPTGAFKAYLTSRGIEAATDFEELSTYIALTVLGCAVHLAFLMMSSPAAPKAKCGPTDAAAEREAEAASLLADGGIRAK